MTQELLNIKLNKTFNFYVHFSDDKNWNLDSYINIINIKNITEAILFEEQLCSKLIQNCMIFIMKDDIGPTWEHPKNKNGGCFSYKINNKYLYKIFKLVYYSLITNKLSGNDVFNKKINGITISPKNTIAPKKFFNLKIWIYVIIWIRKSFIQLKVLIKKVVYLKNIILKINLNKKYIFIFFLKIILII